MVDRPKRRTGLSLYVMVVSFVITIVAPGAARGDGDENIKLKPYEAPIQAPRVAVAAETLASTTTSTSPSLLSTTSSTVVASTTTAPPAACTATMANPKPARNSTVIVSIVSNQSNTPVHVSVGYRTTTTTLAAVTDAAGVANIPIAVGSATAGYEVTVTVTVGAARCSTSFQPV